MPANHAVTLAAAAVVALFAARVDAARRNVLMIAVDDLRTEVSAYPEGNHVITPNIARLAAKSVVFERAYVSVALCMPSRTALLTSRRPDTSKSWTIEGDQTFKNQGYRTIGMGKVFHEGPDCKSQDVAFSWSPEAIFDNSLFDPQCCHEGAGNTLAYAFPDSYEPNLPDGNITNHAVKVIQGLVEDAKKPNAAPFFLAVGLHKPHVPWYAPKRFFDMYPESSINATLRLAPHPTLPTNVPAVAMQNWQVLGWCHGDKDVDCGPLSKAFPLDNTTVADETAAYMRRAYWATTTWTDSNIGRILDAFEPLADNAVQLFWGDHGWQLGDNDLWAKMTNFEHATRIPLMIHVPGVAPGRAPALVEALDIFPTVVAEALGAEHALPPCPPKVSASRLTELCTEGRSLSQLLRNPGNSSWSDAAFSQFPRPEHPARPDLSCPPKGPCPNKMGYTVRVDKFRFTLWLGFNRSTGLANLSDVVAEELYDHSDSPVPVSYAMETVNVAADSAYASVAAQLRERVLGWITAPWD